MTRRLATPCLIVSDAHLGAAPQETERSLLAFLDVAKREAKSVVINGDLFDFWFEWRHVMPRVGFRTLAALASLRDAGVEVLWIAGNHDCWGGDILANDVGVTYHVGPWRGEIGSWQTLIEHGDGLRDVEDAPYRRLRAVLRNPAAIWAFRRILHPDWATALAKRTSHTSRNMRPRDGGDGLKRVAHERLASGDAPDLYIFGHSHVSVVERANGRVLANPGAWLDAPRCLRVASDSVSLCDFDGDGLRDISSEALPDRSPPRPPRPPRPR
ncbi:MAG: UDP-2,3-diacylglucosamine diphosphatase [Gemmatimonadetes bacterium]|nr:UDP-2,3-diacylglucosamine diphosphatase [Gemmatimonadota bacterium]